MEYLKWVEEQKFNIIMLSEHDVTIQFRNTGHYWYLHNTDYPAEGNCVTFHKHNASHPYHLHGRAGTLPQAVRSIKKHDKWQMRKMSIDKILFNDIMVYEKFR